MGHVKDGMNPHWKRQFAEFDLVTKNDSEGRSVIRVGDVEIGGPEFVVMAGPCSVENEKQLMSTAEAVGRAGARILRGGAFKPRSSPYAFQGLGLEGLKLLKKAREATGLYVITEVMSPDDVDLVSEYADILQIGARSMENFSLLEAVAHSNRPVFLKRGLCATLVDLLRSAQFVVENGNPDVILCERGIRTFETATRNTFDIAAIPVLNAVARLPVIADPSHAAGYSDIVPILSVAAAAVGADGILVEVHPQPEKALSDGGQSLTFSEFRSMMHDLENCTALRAHLRGPQLVAASGDAD
jgi:3-deoxy-7-phosphoheptulonate synthase